MTLAASYQRTAAGAKRVVVDTGFVPKPSLRRQHLIMLSRRWIETRQAREARAAAILAATEAARRKHRRTRPFEPGNNGTPPRVIIAQVAAWHGVGAEDIYSHSRVRRIAEARHDAILAVYLNSKINGRRMSSAEIGRVFGRDHTSILSSLRRSGVR